jgi:hypothetical protein
LATYFAFITPVVGSELQLPAICFHLSDAFDLVSQILLLHNTSRLELSRGYKKWAGHCSSTTVLQSLLSMFTSGLCGAITNSVQILDIDTIKSPTNFNPLTI